MTRIYVGSVCPIFPKIPLAQRPLLLPWRPLVLSFLTLSSTPFSGSSSAGSSAPTFTNSLPPCSTRGRSDPGKPTLRIAAVETAFDDLLDDRTEKPFPPAKKTIEFLLQCPL